jgi:Asp/Glu/hydantoin racemase
MTKKIAVIDATKVSLAPVEAAAKRFPDVEIFHLMDEGMSYLAKRDGRITGANMERMASLLHRAEELGVDGIMLSCTIFSPYIDLLRSFVDVPLVAADVGVFEKAAAQYDRIAAIVSFKPTLDSVAVVVRRCRETINPAFDVDIRFADGALAAAAAGDDDTHNRIIYDTALAAAKGKEAVVLSQMSQTRALPLFENFPVPVLTSPPVSLRLLCDMIDAARA